MSRRPVLLTGATGLIGGRLRRRLEGRPMRLLSRSPARVRTSASEEARGWDGLRFEPAHLAGCGAVVHLSGEPLFGVPSRSRLERVRSSRVDSTRSLVEALASVPEEERPEVLVCGSAVGWYGDRGEAELDESAPPGEGFLPALCRDWEAEAARAGELGLRVVSLRTGVVLAADGGALSMMAPAFRLGLGGPLGDGRQWFPWIHVDDETGILARALDDPALEGPVNGVAPEPVRNEELTRALAAQLGRPAFLRVPAFALRLALGELAGELLDSRRVKPARALGAGYAFAHPRLEDALAVELG
ncbi:MAG: TIGR01777 family oxidoreductase [Myxococcota bacterium]|nr:TIGR01777 family oxidoreductase [Myxococcota bacterium]